MKDIDDVPKIKGLDYSEEGLQKSFNELTDELDRLPHIPDDDEEGPHFVNVFDESKLEQLIADIKVQLAKMDEPHEPHEPYTQRFDKERATRTLDKLIGRKGEKK